MTLVEKTVSNPPSDLHERIAALAVHSVGKPWARLTEQEQLQVVILAVRDRAMDVAVATERRYREAGAKRAFYLSLECLLGRMLGNNLVNLGLLDECRSAVGELGGDLDRLIAMEPDMGLGNGGLGRLTADLLDSLATLGMPGYGYCLDYQYGLFQQRIINGCQVEAPDNWMRHGAPWELKLTDECIEVPLYGRVFLGGPADGRVHPQWVDRVVVLGLPSDVPVAGYGGQTVNRLRLFSARAQQDFNINAFDEGHYVEAVRQRSLAETITRVLYPNDAVPRGTELRLVQEYFLVACALRDIVRRMERQGVAIRRLPEAAAIQMNDTHPSLAVAELMRLLVDDHSLEWDEAWGLTVRTLAFTNHTLMPEALEKWPVALLEKVLPRHLQIIYEINRRLLGQVAAKYPGDTGRARRMSLIEEGPVKRVRMAHLALVGSHSINGVARVHSELVKKELLPDFFQMWPERFNNKTNGVTPRRWIRLANPALARQFSAAVGEGWITDMAQLRKIEPWAAEPIFQDAFLRTKKENKQRLADFLTAQGLPGLNPDWMLDVQVKRIHEYKRQLLHLLYVVYAYLGIVQDAKPPAVPQTHLFAGKAAPGYQTAKQIIYLINAVADVINRDPRCEGRLKVFFVPDYRVTLAELIIPAADISEQISTAGTEASGTSNMKLAMNGALTMGTWDGANIEIAEAVGPENAFLFGNRIEQISDLQKRGVAPRTFYDQSPLIRRIMDAFTGDLLSPGQPGAHRWVFQRLVDSWDPFFHLADLELYVQTQEQAAALYADRPAWARKAILNVARMDGFSSDRTAREYARDIWSIAPVPPRRI